MEISTMNTYYVKGVLLYSQPCECEFCPGHEMQLEVLFGIKARSVEGAINLCLMNYCKQLKDPAARWESPPEAGEVNFVNG
jgi:hypothetical protein